MPGGDGFVGVVTSLVSQPPRQSRKAPRLDSDRARTSSGRGGFGNRASEVCRTMPRRTVGLSDRGVSPGGSKMAAASAGSRSRDQMARTMRWVSSVSSSPVKVPSRSSVRTVRWVRQSSVRLGSTGERVGAGSWVNAPNRLGDTCRRYGASIEVSRSVGGRGPRLGRTIGPIRPGRRTMPVCPPARPRPPWPPLPALPALPGVVPGEDRDDGDRPVEGADQPPGLGTLKDARGRVTEGGAAQGVGSVHPEDEVAEVGRLPRGVGPVEKPLPPADEDRVGPADVEPPGRVGRGRVSGDAQRQGREDGEDPLQGERDPGADGHGEDHAARRGGAVGGQPRRLALQPGVLAEVLRRQLEDQRRRLGVGDELRVRRRRAPHDSRVRAAARRRGPQSGTGGCRRDQRGPVARRRRPPRGDETTARQPPRRNGRT